MKVIFWAAVAALIAEAATAGYLIGKYELDEKAKAALVRKGDDFIAHVKAVPPASPVKRAIA